MAGGSPALDVLQLRRPRDGVRSDRIDEVPLTRGGNRDHYPLLRTYERSSQTAIIGWMCRRDRNRHPLVHQGQFLRVIGFVAIVLGLFALVALAVPQMALATPAEESINIADIKLRRTWRQSGKDIFSKGQCALCHSIGPSKSARCPDLKGIGAKLSREFIFEPDGTASYLYLDYRHEGVPKGISGSHAVHQ